MSVTAINRVVEWTPTGVTAIDAGTKQQHSAANLKELSAIFGGGGIVLAISRRSSFVKALRVPNAAATEIDLILQTQMASMFPVPLNELAYSFRLTEDVNEEGRLAVVAAMRETDLQTALVDAKEAGFKVERVIPAGFGAMVLAESLSQPSCAVVQTTTEGLAIDLISGKELRYSRVAPLPKNHDLIESEITRSFAAVGLECAPTVAVKGLEFSDAEFRSATNSLEALASIPLDKIGINLETHETRERRAKSAQRNRTRLAVLLCASAALLALLVYFDYSDQAEVVRKSAGKWQIQINGLRNDRKRLETDVSTLQAKTGSLERAFAPAQKPYEVLNVVVNHLPKDVWLTGLTLERGKMMYIRGTSTTSEGVSDYLQSLTTEPRLREVKLVFSNNGDIDKTPVVQFSIQAFPVGNLPLIDVKKKGAKK